MSLIRRLAEPHNPLENPERRVTGGELVSLLEKYGVTVGGKTSSGKRVTPARAVNVIAVYRAASIIGGLLGSLPFKAFDADKEDRTSESVVLTSPRPDQTPFEWRETIGAHLALWGNYYGFKARSTRTGAVQEVWTYQPDDVTIEVTRPSAENPSGKWFHIRGEDTPRTSRDVFHIPLFSLDGWRGLSPIGVAREAVASALSAEEFANTLWKSGGLVQGILHTESKLQDGHAETLKKRWMDKISGVRNAYDVAVLDAGIKFQQLSLPPVDLQFLEARGFQITEIARLYGLPPHLLSQQERQTSWGTGIEQHNIGFVVYTLEPTWFRRIEQRITAELLPEGIRGEFVVQGLMRGDSIARSQFYRALAQIKAMTPNEIRERENLPPAEWGDEPLELPGAPSDGGDGPEPGSEGAGRSYEDGYDDGYRDGLSDGDSGRRRDDEETE